MPTSPGDSSTSRPDSAPSEKRWIEVAAGLVFRDSRLLITQRPAGTHLAGLWEFPGGKREVGESWEACLARELLEELDAVVEVGPLFDEIHHEYPTKSVHLRFFLCRLRRGEPKPIECAAVAWAERDQLRNFTFPEADAALILRLENSPAVWER